MKLALSLALGALLAGGAQDAWYHLTLTRLDFPPDSIVTAGITLTPEPGAMDATLALTTRCHEKVSATYQARGAVIMIRLKGTSEVRNCPTADVPELYRAHFKRLKPKKYQVVVLNSDDDDHWQGWKAAVADVPPAE
ncbi:MAG TPA: hypothetical protein VFW66_14475 [Gemmatimonadales bacterium]|nr:hypothetical protein [Gemmatimonadales bacterium]